jgi:hypothetical protein
VVPNPFANLQVPPGIRVENRVIGFPDDHHGTGNEQNAQSPHGQGAVKHAGTLAPCLEVIN